MSTRVLVVDDEPPIRELLVEYLRGRGMSAEAVSDGEDARARLAGEPWGLVVTDLKLPGIDGVEVLRAALARDVPTVLMSACGTVDAVVEAHALGARAYLAKPFRLRDAWEVIAGVLAAAARDRRRAWQSSAFELLAAAAAAPDPAAAEALLAPLGALVDAFGEPGVEWRPLGATRWIEVPARPEVTLLVDAVHAALVRTGR